jgi:hypothetical protein
MVFFDRFHRALADKLFEKPDVDFKSLLDDLKKSYELVDTLIGSYLDDKPIDVFHINS